MTEPSSFSNLEQDLLQSALSEAGRVRHLTSPNPWVGAALRCTDGSVFTGATEAPGGRHAEIVALDAARAAKADPTGATMAVTLEPCNHQGRTGPCTEALIEAGVGRVIIGVADPDPLVAGTGIDRLRQAGIEVALLQGGAGQAAHSSRQVADQLAPYLHHRRTGRPWVVLKLAATLDGGTAAPDATSQWITGPEARLDTHRVRAESDAIVVGAATVRVDDPALTVRLPERPDGTPDPLDGHDPERVVLVNDPATISATAKVRPCRFESGPLDEVLKRLGADGVIQLMVEGGATVAAEFHRSGLVDQYVLYLAPALFGGGDHRGLFTGPGATTMSQLWRGEITSVAQLGSDLRIDLAPARHPATSTPATSNPATSTPATSTPATSNPYSSDPYEETPCSPAS